MTLETFMLNKFYFLGETKLSSCKPVEYIAVPWLVREPEEHQNGNGRKEGTGDSSIH